MSRSQRPRILLVDDDPAVRRAVARYLRRHGCEVETAANGQEGLDRLAQDRFDAVVSDIDMPRMDGVSLRRLALERDPSLRHRFLLCSAMRPETWGVDPTTVAFLTKPFEVTELWAALGRLLATPQNPPGTGGR